MTEHGALPAAPVAAGTARGAASLRDRPRLWLFVPVEQWRRMLLVSAVAAVVSAPLYMDDSWWLSLGVMLAVLVFWHTLAVSRTLPWVPGAAACIALIQGVLAPWASYHLVSGLRIAPMWVPAQEYFELAVPAAAALVVGLVLPSLRLGRRPLPRAVLRPSPRMLRTLELMVFGGLAVRLGVVPFAPGALRFATQLAANLSYVGAFGLMLAGVPNWWTRLAPLLAVDAVQCAIDQQFLVVVLWVIYFGMLAVYRFRLSGRTVAGWGSLAAVAIIALNGMKYDFRNTVRASGMQSGERVALAWRSWYTLATSPELVFSEANLAFNVSRLNQGAITSRVMMWTPSAEPFAGGETIATAVRAAIVPRAVDPGKYTAGGFENYPRFTGLRLNPGTSINLSVPGEMYANFGLFGGCIGVFVYALALGLVSGFVTRRAARSPLWWAWLPFLLYSVLPAESGVGETLNQVSKSLVVMWAVLTFVPTWRAFRARTRRGRPAAASVRVVGLTTAEQGGGR